MHGPSDWSGWGLYASPPFAGDFDSIRIAHTGVVLGHYASVGLIYGLPLILAAELLPGPTGRPTNEHNGDQRCTCLAATSPATVFDGVAGYATSEGPSPQHAQGGERRT